LSLNFPTAEPVESVVAVWLTAVPSDFVIVNVTPAVETGDPPELALAVTDTVWPPVYVSLSVDTETSRVVPVVPMT